MKKKNTAQFDEEDDMLPKYDLRQMRVVKRGPGHQQKDSARIVRVTLDPDVAEVFGDEKAVNEALRTVLRVVVASQ